MEKEKEIAKKLKELQELVGELKEMGVGYLLVTSFEKSVDDEGFQELRSSVFSDFKLGDMAPAIASYFSENPDILPVIVRILASRFSQEMLVEKAKKAGEELARKRRSGINHSFSRLTDPFTNHISKSYHYRLTGVKIAFVIE